jgi:hypothetical protein
VIPVDGFVAIEVKQSKAKQSKAKQSKEKRRGG